MNAPAASLLDTLLGEQRALTLVEKFAWMHEREELPAEVRRHRELIPLSAPGPGQQYAFEVELDSCTGCKACVTGCHNLNGLDDGEVWRTVGLLHGGTAQAPVQQTVTTACHHCVEPACMIGCPVKAYEKDPVSGIVKHLDNQCIGCQYCLFMCPYDAPKLNRQRGIVRKCDMCSDRLAEREAPACVQACPNEAIRITVVDQAQVIEAAQASSFVPGAAAPGDTLPTTNYRTHKPSPRNLLPADFYVVNPEHSHPALVIMLVLTQLSVGAFCVDYVTREALGGARTLGTSNALFALVLGLAAMGASVFHLGRPLYAFRAFLGLRTSWLSREIVGFTLFALFATVYAAVGTLRPELEVVVALTGVGAIFCSVMVYAATRRDCWSVSTTGFKFSFTTIVLGTAAIVMTSAIAGALPPTLCVALVVAAGLKLAVELTSFRHLRTRPHTARKRSAMLMWGDLARATWFRFVCGALGGVALPALLWAADPRDRAWVVFCGVASFGLSLTGELLERYLFFAAASAPKMPGGHG